MRYACIALILALAGIGNPALAAQDGNKLYESCRLAQVKQDGVSNKDFDFDDYYRVGYCDGMVQGVSEALANQKHFCLPKDIRFPQLTRLVADYLEAHPEQRSLKASQAAYNALLSRYPCIVDP